MFTDAGGGTDAAQYKAQKRKTADDIIPYVGKGHQLPAEHLGKGGGIFGIPAAKGIVGTAHNAGSDGSRDQAGSDTLHKERKPNEGDENAGRRKEII